MLWGLVFYPILSLYLGHAAEFRFQEERELGLKGARVVRVYNRLGGVRVMPWVGERVKVTASHVVQANSEDEAQAQLKKLELHLEATPQEVQVQILQGKGQSILDRLKARKEAQGPRVDLVVRVPSKIKLLVFGATEPIRISDFQGDLDLTSGEGRVEITHSSLKSIRIRCGDCEVDLRDVSSKIQIQSRSGELRFENVRASDAFVSAGMASVSATQIKGSFLIVTDGGDVDLAGLTGKFDIRTQSGSVKASEIRGSGNASTRSGRVSLEFREWKDSDVARFESESGAIFITLPSKFEGELDATSVESTLALHYPVERNVNASRFYGPIPLNSIQGKIGNPGSQSVRLKVVSQSGQVQILKGI